jgi:hypothetical protein
MFRKILLGGIVEGIKAISYLLPSEMRNAKGEEAGTCILCGVETEEGFPVEFSSTFTAFSHLAYGNVLCPSCNAFFRNQDFRRRSWKITPCGVEFLKREQVLEFLTTEEKPIPFAVYITSTGQKQGWLQGFRYVNFSKQKFFIHTDFVGCVLAEYRQVVEFAELIKFLREKKVSKTELTSGEFSMYTYRRSIENNFELELRKAKEFVSQPLWEVMVYVC